MTASMVADQRNLNSEGRGIPNRVREFSRTRSFRVAVLFGVAVFLELLMFRSYFRGESIPPWDFLGGYTTDAYIWWSQGGFFDPIDWVPNTWGGYPAALLLQNSAWYLPVGISSLFTPFTPHSAAVLSALHVGLGFFGTYLLVRSFRVRFVVALLAACAAFFAVGYYSNASHIDIARGYALIPWVLLVVSTRWHWKKWWGVPVAALVLWQAITGIYPGMLVSTAYAGLAWVVTLILIDRPKWRAYLLPLSIAGLAAVLLSAPRLLPYFAIPSDGAAAGLPEVSAFTPMSVGTLLFGYSSTDLLNDVTMRSFFVPATVLLLALFADFRSTLFKAGLSIFSVAFLLGMPFWPWYEASQRLPGLGLSRFTMSDFKVFFTLGLVLIAASGLSALIRIAPRRALPRSMWFRSIAAGLLVVGFGLIAITGPFTRDEWFWSYVTLVAAVAVVLGYLLLLRRRHYARTIVALALVALTVVSGVIWANTTKQPWFAARADSESVIYGDTVDDLLDHQTDQTEAVQRPARVPLAENSTIPEMYSYAWNRVYYLGTSSVGGYISLKGSQTQELMRDALVDPVKGDAFADFLAAAGAVLTKQGDSAPTAEELKSCASGAGCGPASIAPLEYSVGNFEYSVKTPAPVTAYLNESYFSGWIAQACDGSGQCNTLTPTVSEMGVVKIMLPEGDYRLSLSYHTAGRDIGWALFVLGVTCSIAPALIVFTRTAKRRRKEALV